MGHKRPRIIGRYRRARESRDDYLRRLELRRLRFMLGGAYTLGLARPEMEYEPMIHLYGHTSLSKYIFSQFSLFPSDEKRDKCFYL